MLAAPRWLTFFQLYNSKTLLHDLYVFELYLRKASYSSIPIYIQSSEAHLIEGGTICFMILLRTVPFASQYSGQKKKCS